jgi:hypothetical protein
MAYAAKRGKNGCPTHPGALLRDDIIPATGRTKAGIAALLAIFAPASLRHPAGKKAGFPDHRGSPRLAFWRRCGNLDADAGRYDTWHAERGEDVRHIPTIKTKAA